MNNFYNQINFFIGILFLASCGGGAIKEEKSFIKAGPESRKEIQNALIQAQPGDTLFFDEGVFEMDLGISILDKENIALVGKGHEKTIFSFAEQKKGASGAEGILAKNMKNVTFMDLAVVETTGDAIKVQDSDGVIFMNVRTEWAGAKPENGAYGLYPVTCSNVLIDGCIAKGASDAGIYVGQSKNVIVRNCYAERNVAGIEIENTTNSDVYNNEATGNTGGILMFNLPDLPVKGGGHTRVYNNKVYKNNLGNFAPEGNMVATIPAGTGMFVLASRNIEIFDNEILDNATGGIGIISYFFTQIPVKDSLFNPFPTAIYIHNNKFSQDLSVEPDMTKDIGPMVKQFEAQLGRRPDIMHDGVIHPEMGKTVQEMPAESRFCIKDNGEVVIVNLQDPTTPPEAYNCELAPLEEANVQVAGKEIASL
ncbi:parallel beta-helix domain-containing protein [Flexithrix dorotheae]|uniref:parallel beta-helix domain-containing protein n=1 Tax=Flexithrix dorotheae TaxID=70993 RepID=UPI0003781049|nr:parallel beta-helix domain-containing protein [Flexithrix dorotheae]